MGEECEQREIRQHIFFVFLLWCLTWRVCCCFLSLLSHLISDKWQAKDGRVKATSQVDAALDKEEDSVPGHSKSQGQSQKTKVTKKTATFRRLREQRTQERQDEEPHVIPFNKGIKMMSEREATELAQNGEVLTWSPDSEGEQTIGKTPPESDTTGSTPEIFKSPELIQGRVPGSNAVDKTLVEETVVEKTVPPRKYKGWVLHPRD